MPVTIGHQESALRLQSGTCSLPSFSVPPLVGKVRAFLVALAEARGCCIW